jgi:hypothetical protein
MSIAGIYKVTARGKRQGGAVLAIRADTITAATDGTLYLTGLRQKRRLTPDMWSSITIENDGAASGLEADDA